MTSRQPNLMVVMSMTCGQPNLTDGGYRRISQSKQKPQSHESECVDAVVMPWPSMRLVEASTPAILKCSYSRTA